MIKYGEMTTKKDNLKVFVDKLYNNVNNKLKDYDVVITKNNTIFISYFLKIQQFVYYV